MKQVLMLIAVIALAGCDTGLSPTPPSAPPLPATPQDDTCGATAYAGLIGQDATALERVLIMRPVRVIRPGMAVTMDFSPSRINFEISQEEKISRIYCG